MITWKVMWQDLNKETQERIIKAFGDNNNWDVIPITEIEFEDERNIVLDSFLGDDWGEEK